MDFNTLRENLKLQYKQSNWSDWLKYFFADQISIETKSEKVVIENGKAKSIERFAAIALCDNRNIAVLDIETTSDVKIARNRVALRDIVFKLIDQDKYHGLLVFYHSEDETQKDYRLSFISSLTEFDADGNLIKQSTHPKRFSFVLGANETCTTATYRLLDLKNKAPKFKAFEKQKGISLKDVTDTFSVEALNNEFFKKYKDIHYKRFWEYIANEDAFASKLLNLDEQELVKQQKPIRDFVKKMLGRIVFLHFLQKKGWLGCPADAATWVGGDKNFMQNLFTHFPDQEQFYSKCLTTLFYETLNTKRDNDIAPFKIKDTSFKIPFLNGGLFDDDQKQTNHFNFPVEYFKDLFDFFEQYNFTIDENSPEEQEVGIDPEMLGHIFENLLEENKDKGAFYTPKEIVHYMCQESLIQYLRTHLSECTEAESQATKAIETFIRKDDIGNRHDKKNFLVANAKRIEAILDKVKICDPAIGSGAFPMGMLQEIFKAKTTLDLTLDKAQVKKDIIQNSIYGVDLEKGAVDIARLRFWLSLVVDEDVPQPLPNLDYKIMQGNSLLESFEEIDLSTLLKDENSNEIIVAKKQQIEMQGFGNNQPIMLFEKKDKAELQELINLYFDFEPSKKHKYTSKQQVKQAINAIVEGKLKAHFYREKLKLDSQLVDAIKLAKTITVSNTQAKAIQLKNQKAKETYDKKIVTLEQKITHLTEIVDKLNQWEKDDKERPYFLWHTYFKDVFDVGGFDIVIGNPPYIQMQKDAGKLSVLLENAGYKTFERTGDIYSLFYEKGVNILKGRGVLCYITSNKWMRAGYGESTRKFFAENTNPILLIDFAGQKIFDAATVDVNILMFSKEKNQQKTLACIVKENVLNNLSVFVRQEGAECSFSNKESWTILNPIEQSIKKKIEAIGTPLKDWDINIYRGILTGYNEAFVIDEYTKDKLIKEDVKSAEIIRPILRGRDIKRYGYEFANLYLIATFPSLKIDIEKYPAIKQYLLSFGMERLEQTGKEYTLKGEKIKARKKTTNKWFETQDSIGYWDDFLRPKIIYPNMTKFLPFVYDDKGFLTNQKCFIITGKQVAYLTAFFNSSLFKYCFRDNFPELQGGTRELSKIFFDKIPVLKVSDKTNLEFQELVVLMQSAVVKKQATKKIEVEIDKLIFDLYSLTEEERKTIGFIEIQ